ncbi:Plasma membrane fusion protein PRM1 [Cercospora zeina]
MASPTFAAVAPRPPSQIDPYPTPYLGLRARLSQTWINRWTILLLLVLIRTIFAIASVDGNLAIARKQALSACTSVEHVGSAMASMPHYMSQGLNELTAESIEKAINGLMQMLVLTLAGVEEIVVFVINMLTQTYVCLITLAISGGLHVAVSVAEDVGDFLNSTAKEVGKGLGDVAEDFQNAMNGFMDGINDIGNFFSGDNDKPPTINLRDEIQKLDSLQLPTGYDQGLQDLNKSIPTFAQVNNLTQTAIRFPFEEVKKLLNDSLPRYTMNRSRFPVPAKERLTFCSDNNGVNDFFDDLVHIERMAKKVFYAVLITLAILAMAPMAWREIRRWRMMQERAKLVKNEAHDSMDAVYLVSRPYTSSLGLWASKKFSSARRRALVRWSVAYATTVPALFVLSLAIAGLLSCLCQYVLLQALKQEVPKLENQIVGFTDKVLLQLNNASEQWAVGTNAIINNTNTEINHDVFGWVNTTTGAINNTLNVFVDEMTGALNTTFGGTILYDPILEVLNCLILLKIQGIQKGLTWVGEHAKIDIPLLRNDTFSLGTVAKVGDAQPNIWATGPDGAAADAISDAVNFVIRSLEFAIRQEAIISTCVLLIWVIIALMGLGRAIYLMCGNDTGSSVTVTPKLRRSLSSARTEKYELNEFPEHERAAKVTQPGNHRGNLYNGQSYTLTPAPMPVLDRNSPTPVPAGSPPSLRSNPFLRSSDYKPPQRNPFADPGR